MMVHILKTLCYISAVTGYFTWIMRLWMRHLHVTSPIVITQIQNSVQHMVKAFRLLYTRAIFTFSTNLVNGVLMDYLCTKLHYINPNIAGQNRLKSQL